MPQKRLLQGSCSPPVLSLHDYSIYAPSYLTLNREGDSDLGNGRHKVRGVMCLLQRTVCGLMWHVAWGPGHVGSRMTGV